MNGPARPCYRIDVDELISRGMLESLTLVAPGTPLREGIDRILAANSGGLIVLGCGPKVERICTGGFLIEAQLTPQRMSELSKMDGAIVLDEQAEVIVRANVHLVPDPDQITTETGTRHRSAEKTARETGVPVVSVSARMAQITVYRGDQKHILQPITRVLSRANQAAATLERYRGRFDAVSASLSALEVEDLVTARDVLLVLQRGEMVRRISEVTEMLLVELGVEGRLLHLQVGELAAGIDHELELVVRDYLADTKVDAVDQALDALVQLSMERLPDLYTVAQVLDVGGGSIDSAMTPRGFRFLSRIPRLSSTIIDRIVARFDSLQKILNAGMGELEQIDGVGEVRALQIKEGLARLAESSILDRYS